MALTKTKHACASKNSETVHRLPKPIWLKIFEHLKAETVSQNNLGFKDSNIYWNFCLASRKFEDILEENKAAWLFSEIMPFIFLRLDAKEVLACRQVCQWWRWGVDHFLEYEQEYFSFHEKRYSGIRHLIIGKYTYLIDPLLENDVFDWQRLVLETTFTFNKISNVDNLSLDTEKYVNIFPGRTFRLSLLPNSILVTNKDRYYNLLTNHLMKFVKRQGSLLRVVSLQVSITDFFTAKDFCLWLHEFLKYTPNLRRLRICAETEIAIDFPAFEKIEAFSDQLIRLPNLEALEYSRVSYTSLPTTIQKYITQSYASQLRRLVISFVHRVGERSKIEMGHFSNLEELQVLVENTQQINELFRLNYFPKLSILYIGFQINLKNQQQFDPVVINLKEILTSVLKFSDTLEVLVLGANNFYNFKFVALQEDVLLFNEFRKLKLLSCSNFSLRRLKILDSMPQSLRCLALTSHTREDDRSLYELFTHEFFRYSRQVVRHFLCMCCFCYCCCLCQTSNSCQNGEKGFDNGRRVIRCYHVCLDLPSTHFYNREKLCKVLFRQLPGLECFIETHTDGVSSCLYQKDVYEQRLVVKSD